jgi:hypothetical protein
MRRRKFDCIELGLGGFGSAAIETPAQRGDPA